MKRQLMKVFTAMLLMLMPNLIFAQAPTLGTCANFVLFTSAGAITNSGLPQLTHLTGDVGSNSGAGTGFGNVDGVMHSGDAATGAATADLTIAYNQLNAAIPTFFPSSLLGNGDTLLPGVYHIPSAATMNLELVLDAQGDANAVFIFQIEGSFSVAAGSKVKIINAGLACNVFWKVEGLVSVAGGSTMRGTIVAHNAAINMNVLDTLEGRALSLNGAITTNALLAYKPIGCGSAVLTGPAAPPLVSAAAYGVFSAIGPVTATGITHVVGDVGTNSGLTTGFNPLFVTGMIHPVPDASTAACASDLTNTYNALTATPVDIVLLYPALFGYDLVLTPHTYNLGAATMLTGSVYLNAQGHPNSIFIIKINGAFNTSTLSRVMLINGAQAKNVYWQVNGATHVFDNSVFNGNIIGAGAITFNTGDTLNGRALTINGAVAINGSYINDSSTSCTAPPITGTMNVCPGAMTTLADSDTGGTWSSSNNTVAMIGSASGIVTGMTPGIDTISYHTLLGCISTTTITVNNAPNAITGPGSVCTASSIVLNSTTPGGTWTSSNTAVATAGTISGIVTGVSAGTTTITYLASGCFATKSLTVSPSGAASISGSSSVCIGSSTPYTSTTSGGVWSSSSTNASVSTTGIVTGVTAGSSTISYAVSSSCGTAYATKSITVTSTATAGTISGPATVCTGTTITLTSDVTGGSWLSTNTAAATINSASGVVTGVATGTTTITYTVVSGCGTAYASKIISVSPSAAPAAITGASTVCVGSSTPYSDATPGGIWSSSNTKATVSPTGSVTGVTPGTAIISYGVTGTCGTLYATKAITVTTSATAGTIVGSSAVCTGSTMTLTSTVPGGTWLSTNTSAATINSASGLVTGVAPGTTTISYTTTSSCGTVVATRIVTVNASPSAGTISGASAICAGFPVTFTDATPGGVWSSSNSNAVVSPTGLVTGITAGTAIVSYAVSNLCGTAYATKAITVTTTATAGTISGPATVCPGNNITLTSDIAGGTWMSTNTSVATVTTAGGLVHGIASGTTTLSYTVVSGCGTGYASTVITVSPTPSAGTISGAASVCVGSTTTLTDAVTGGVWTSSNSNATVSTTGIVSGITTGTSLISYAVTGACGTAYAVHSISIIDIPTPGTITGLATVCSGSSITLTSSTTGGTWTSASPAIASVSATGIVNGAIPGTTTISYTVGNACGSASALSVVTVRPLPNAGLILGLPTVCIGSTIILSNLATGGVWTSSNAKATVVAGSVTGLIAGVDTISYTVTNSCGSATATKTIGINPLPNAGSITGGSSVCVGSTIIMANATSGGIWSARNARATITTVGLTTGVTAGADTILYSVTNVCGITVATKAIVVNALPLVPVIATQSPAALCKGVMYQNFGAATLPPAGTTYNWTAGNATVWAQGTFHQYALVNFTSTGLAMITLNATTTGTACTSNATVVVNVGSVNAETPTVSYFGSHFICTPNDEATYQWGYDDKMTLDSTILTGEINQDYLNASPDFTNKYYWVMTTKGGCSQKSYYGAPLTVHAVNNDVTMSVYPNPARNFVNIALTAMPQGDVQITVMNISGSIISTQQITASNTTVDISAIPAGIYLVNCYSNGAKVAATKFIKN